MNYIDIIIIVITIIFAVRGWKRGFVYELFGMSIILIGLVTAFIFFKPVSNIINQFINNRDLSLVVAFIVVFVGVAISLTIIRNIISGFIENLNITDIDSILGLVFSVLKVFLIMAFILLIIDKYSFFGIENHIRSSIFYPVIKKVFYAVISILPEGVKNFISTLI